MLIRTSTSGGKEEIRKRVREGMLSPPGRLMGLKREQREKGFKYDPILLIGYLIEPNSGHPYFSDPWSIYPIFLVGDHISYFTWGELKRDWELLQYIEYL
jgi:hypothetical protein